MNRIIKFRAWSVKEKMMCSSLGDVNLEMVEKGLITHDGENYTEAIYMQFTGLYDRDGKEVFEGDIIDRYLGYPPRVVTWMPEGRYTGWFATDETREGVMKHLPIAENNDFRVIGNVWEHPELLQVTDTNGNP